MTFVSTKTELRLEYAYYSWNYEFPPEVEDALENDFVMHRYLYGKETLERVKVLLLIYPDASAQEVMDTVRVV